MRDRVYLTFDRHGVRQMTKRQPNLSAGQYAVAIVVSADAAFFDRRIPEAEIFIPEGSIIEPTVDVDAGPELEETEP